MASDPAGTGSVEILVGTAGYPRLLRWTMSWPRADGGVRKWHSYALTTSDGPVLIDPVMPDGKTLSQLETYVEQMGGLPAASLLTNDMHERSAYAARTQYSVPVWAPTAFTVPRIAFRVASCPFPFTPRSRATPSSRGPCLMAE